MPLYGWYGDDFTGATDTLACLARLGVRAMLFLGVPSPQQLAAAGPLDAVGIAGASRSMTPDAMAPELARAGRFFAGLGVRVLHYKCCSTFDSAPCVGSIGEAIRVLNESFPNPLVPIVGGQPDIGRYCAFSTLFAAAGSGGAVHRLDRHPTMSLHPVTPMAEADLRRHLACQGLQGVGAIHYPTYDGGAEAVEAALREAAESGAPAVLLDVTRRDELALLGGIIWSHALARPMLAVGPSSVADAVASSWQCTAPPSPPPLPPASGPVFVMVGSLSPVTRRQVEASPSYVRLHLPAEECWREVWERATRLLQAERSVMVQTAQPEGKVAPSMAARVARETASFVAGIMQSVPLSRVGIAGGDTSSLAALGLGIWGLSYRTSLAPGVALCSTRSDVAALDGVDLMLKGGQMGPPELFEVLVHGTRSGRPPG